MKNDIPITVLPNPIGRMIITVFDNGDCRVENFPENIHVAKNWLDAAMKTVFMHFIEAAKKGRIANDGSIKRSPIEIVPHKIIMN